MSSLATKEEPPCNTKVGEEGAGSSLGQGSAGTWREGREKGRGEEDGRQGRREMEGTVRKEREESEQHLASG